MSLPSLLLQLHCCNDASAQAALSVSLGCIVMIHMSEPLGNGCFHDPVRRRVSGLKVQAFWKTGALIAHIPSLCV